MWVCPYCGGNHGLPFHDDQLTGVLCLSADCGRFVEEDVISNDKSDWDNMDL
ncbi:hypothetical protein [Brevibacillus sp. SAFN-007a]|uniref:hypothetical protein n=1 Tax=Brevibacillus sp. SAFN-007a TaxID=3436862 RepID=UPI003F7DB42D